MSRTVSRRNRSFWPSYVAFLLFIFILTLQRVNAGPLAFLSQTQENSTPKNSAENLTKSPIENLTENPIKNVTKHPVENLTKSPTENLTENPIENVTKNPVENVTKNLVENLTSIPAKTANSMDIEPSTDVYVVKAVVYEIGILADTNDTTSSENTERQERVDISVYSQPQEDKFS